MAMLTSRLHRISLSNTVHALCIVVLAIGLVTVLPTTSASPIIARPTQTLHLISPRNGAAVPSDASGVTQVRAAAAASASASASVRATASAPATTNTGSYGGLFGGSGLPSSFLTWIAVAIAIGIGFSLMLARFFYIRRYYPVTPRSYFLPSSGIHWPRLGIHINGPPPRLPPPPPYGLAVMEGRRRRPRRDRTTRGADIAEGGARRGNRDVDDDFDGEGDDEHGQQQQQPQLPMYSLDTSLPAYSAPDSRDVEAIAARAGAGHVVGEVQGEGTDVTSAGMLSLPPAVGTAREPATAPATTTLASSGTTTTTEEQLPSVQDYEQQTRDARDRHPHSHAHAAATLDPFPSSNNQPDPTSASIPSSSAAPTRPALLGRLSSRLGLGLGLGLGMGFGSGSADSSATYPPAPVPVATMTSGDSIGDGARRGGDRGGAGAGGQGSAENVGTSSSASSSSSSSKRGKNRRRQSNDTDEDGTLSSSLSLVKDGDGGEGVHGASARMSAANDEDRGGEGGVEMQEMTERQDMRR